MIRTLKGLVIRAGLVAVCAATLCAGAQPAHAAPPVDSGSFDFTDSEVFDGCGIPLLVTTTVSGTFAIRPAPGDPAGEAFLLHQRVSFESVYTNPANGRWVREYGHSTLREMRGTLVEGTVYRFDVQETGVPYVLETSSHRVLLRDSGVVRWHALWDTLGDGVPGALKLTDDEVDLVAGRHPSWGADTCALALANL